MNEEKKIYVGNLEYSVNEDELKQIMSEKGLTPKDVKVIKDKATGRSKGFGFAEFETDEQVEAAITTLEGVDLKGRQLKVSKARKMEPRSNSYDRNGGGGGFGGGMGGGGRFRR
jgi:RNA recognition motif-containing protein